MKALVSGGAGFIGRHMVRALLDAGWDVTAFDIYPRNEPGVRFRDARAFFSADATTFDLVVHAAAVEPHRSAIDTTPLRVGAGNLELDAAMFQWAARAKPGRVVYLSSSAAYPVWLQTGAHAYRLTEDDAKKAHQPDAMYGELKLMGERLADAYRRQGGTVTVCRPFSGYGEDQSEDFPFGAFTARARRRDDPFEVWGDGSQTRDWVHVDDVVGAILAAYEHGIDGPVNIATGRPTSFNELATLFMVASGYCPEIKHLTDAPRGVAYRVGDPTLLNTFYECQVTLEEGIKRALFGGKRA